MKYLLIVVLLFAACEEYHDEEFTIEMYGLCGEYCIEQDCVEFFNGTECYDHGLIGECSNKKCWHDWSPTYEIGEPIRWPVRPI
jgi:hypothetical protein